MRRKAEKVGDFLFVGCVDECFFGVCFVYFGGFVVILVVLFVFTIILRGRVPFFVLILACLILNHGK